jgi:hypothetical protein
MFRVVEYLQRFDVVHMQVWDADEEYGEVEKALEGAGKPYMLSFALLDVVHKYELRNVVVMQPWLR